MFSVRNSNHLVFPLAILLPLVDPSRFSSLLCAAERMSISFSSFCVFFLMRAASAINRQSYCRRRLSSASGSFMLVFDRSKKSINFFEYCSSSTRAPRRPPLSFSLPSLFASNYVRQVLRL